MPQGQKHLIECNCILPQFRRQANPPFHKFIVFSVVNDDGTVEQKYSQCNNCGAIHRVTDVCKSEILVGREKSNAVISIDDIKPSLTKEIAEVLTKYNADVATWEQAQFIIENQRWGEFVVLPSETVENERQGKMLRILGNSIFKITPFSYTQIVG